MLRVLQIYKSFQSAFGPVLSDVNLELAKGEFCVLIGSNGSGKSTLLRTVTGEYACDSGTVFIDGEDVTHQPLHSRAKHISSVTQDVNTGTVQEMTLLENVVLSLMRGKKGGFRFYQTQSEKITAAVGSLGLGLEKYLHSPLSTLSGGQRQAIATLMAVLSKPKLLLLDEHTSALDPKTQRLLMDYTAEQVHESGLTTLMITHNLDDAARYGNRLIMLHRGKIVLDVKGEQKAALGVAGLLNLFHKYEDQTLAQMGGSIT